MWKFSGHNQHNPTSRLSHFFALVTVVGMLLSATAVQPVNAAGTDLNLTKTVEGGITTAQVGDIIRYRIHFACSNLITPCGPMEITDVLQPGLIYQPPPASSVPAGFSINYNAGTRTITITKDDNNLLDGSQYDAVIAVQVDYDLRPLPAIINNTVNGRIAPTGPGNWENTTPASAPPITIGTVTPSWALTKSLSSPTINPTVNTDVTYRLQLCPTTPPPGQGNVPLRNIVFTDTLPAGATFVSASDGGTESGGVVTWPAYAGPVVPPNCLTRYVTIRYNSPPFNIGDNVTNMASVDGQYTDSTGATIGPGTGLATDPILHPIDPIFETPNYSKDDAGDPIGFTGTGRFVLNLDTVGTNYPSNELILIDNLPPELQVTSVTSGQWDASFDFVQAYVEYSTNNGSTYTAFPGQPISYNTNAIYTAPVTNITNVRWRFEYDPDATAPFNFTQAGLPYTWSFTTRPEIRVLPRSSATVADPPSNAPMPAAVPGNTYNNCLQVSRTNSSGSAITDPCNIEPLTVNGTYVSLRTYKNETPGEMWDDLSDPNITNFVADGSILPGDTLRYRITVEITERSSAPLVNPTIQDTMPAASDFIFVRNGTAQLDGVDLPAAQQPTFTQVGQVLTWAWNNPSPALTINPLSLGSRFLTVEFFARIPRGQAPNTYTNTLYTVTDSIDAVCENGTQVQDSANGDVDGDGDATDPACRVPDTYVVERSAALRGEKWIRSTDPGNSQVVLAATFLPSATCPNGGTTGLPGGGANPFTRYPCISQAFREGALSAGQYAPPPANTAMDDFEYNLRIFNDGNVPMLSYVLYDILPYVGDTGSGGVLSTSARLSEFRPILRGPVAFISGLGLTSADFTIEYNDTINPCRPEVFDQPTGTLLPAGCDDNWSSTWSTSARSYRIRLNSGALIQPASTSSEVRFGVPMYIPADAPPTGEETNDALPHEIAWNSFAHVGSYDSDPSAAVVVQDLLASEPRKVGITVPEQMSVGNRVWRDADNSGTINPPDDTNPGIPGVTVNLYRDTDNNGIPDGAAIGTTLTDSNGYYLFSNITYDLVTLNNNRYIIGIPASNFNAGQPLESLRSSTGTPPNTTYTAPTLNTTDSADDGIDPLTPGQEVLSPSFLLQTGTEPTSEADLSSNDRDGMPGERRGVNSEPDDSSDLTIDFGFFGGNDIPFSIGNHVWYDNGQTAPGVYNYAQRNDGIRQGTEPQVVGATVRLYRDGNANGIPEAAEMIRTDVTDANGFYLFDNLDPGPYYVEIPASNFANGQPLAGWYSSQPTGTETTGVNGGTATADIDNDDNGINSNFPENTGIFSGVIVLTRGINEPLGETYKSNEADPGSPANQTYNPTGWDGPSSIGRFGETDATSNITIDFGFIPPMSLGNRVWIDEGVGTTPFRTGYNNGLQDGSEVGVSGVTVQLWRDTNGTPGLQTSGGADTLMYTTTTDATGYYLFDRLQPASDYYVHIPTSNFTAGGALQNYLSSTDTNQTTAPADDIEDTDDDGIDSATPATTGITSPQIAMSYNGESTSETDINNSGTYGPQNRGNYGQDDSDSNLTVDFGFVRPPRSLGNRLWIDSNNNGQVDGGETAVPTGVRVSLYLDTNGDNQPDDLGVIGDRTDDWIAYDLTDANGYYLFDNLPPNSYIVGVDRTNFAVAGLLEGYNSSTGNVDNGSNNTDDRDNGVDRLNRADPVASPHGILSTRINLTATPVNAPTGEVGSGDTNTTLGFNPTAGDGANSRGRFGETDANSDLTIDFGFFIPMSLGNRVFLDDGTGGGTYNNGIMDGGELPIANVRVELYRDANTDGVPDAGLVAFDTTDANGYYLFDDLAEGSYVVVIPASNFNGAAPLVGYNTSTPTGTENAGVAGNTYTPNTDRDDNGLNVGTAPTTGGVRSGTITLTHDTEPNGESELSAEADPGSPANLNFSPTGWDGAFSRGRWDEKEINSNLTVDFGFIPVFALGNRVFFDTNNNSLRAGAEVGVNNVRVQLFASDGTTEIPVGPDGILYTADDATGGMLTAGGGYYRFNNLPAGDYIVRIPASNFGVGQPLLGTRSSATTISNAGVISETVAPDPDTTATDSDDNGTLVSGNVDSAVVTLGPTITSEPTGEADLSGGQGQPDGQANMTVDFGFYTITQGNLVWADNGTGGGTANDGVRNGTEPGINGVTVQLWSQDGSTQLATTTTAGGGVYTFTGLAQGNYIVRIPANQFQAGGALQNYRSSTGAVPPSTYEPAPNPDVNTTDSDDNGTETGGLLGSGGYVQTSAFALTPAAEQAVNNATGLTTENRVDFGFTNLVALGNRVWFDTGAGALSNNHILDAGEVGVDNVTVQLFTSAGVEVPVGPDGILGTADDALGGMQTLGGGYYRFDRLLSGTYYVFIPATEFQAGGDLQSYYSSVGNGANETSDQNVDENGIDNAAPAVNGIRSTNFTLVPGTEQTGEDQSNYTGALPDANVNFTADFGFVQKYSIGNRVWFDTDNSSTINGTEVGIDGVTVNLYAASDLTTILATDTTTNGGYYLFDDLYAGDYVVAVASSNFAGALNGYWSSATSRTAAGALTETTAALANTDTDSDDNGTRQTAGALNGAVISSTVTLGPTGNTEPTTETDLESGIGQGNQANGRANMTVDFGFYRTEIGNLVFTDANNNGTYDAGDGLLQNVTVQLYSGDGTTLLATTTTNAAGDYRFNGQPAGDYVIRVTTPTGMTSTVDTFDSADNANPDVNTDNNDNGIGENAGTVSSGVLTMTAAEAAANITTANATGTTTDLTVDFGFVPLYSLGNRVWFDTNNNSLMDAGEVGVNDVTIQLYRADVSGNPTGAVLATDVTSAGAGSGNGYYLFDDLYPRDYVVVIPASNFAAGGPLEGYWSSATSLTAGGAITETAAPDADINAADADDNGTRQTSGLFSGAVISSAVTLGPSGGTEPVGELATQLESGVLGNQGNQPDDRANMTVDFGFYRTEIGNLVFIDSDGNGNYESATNPVLPGATVQLYASNGATEINVGPDGILNTADDASGGMLSDVNGLYRFAGLPAGDYIVRTTPPSGMASTIDTFNPADSADPDTNVDNNDNGIGQGFTTVSANTLTMIPGEVAANITVTNANGTTIDTTVDFGFIGMVALGNRVWYDTGAGGGISNNGILDGGETGVPGLRVELYTSTGTFVDFTTTDIDGYYEFDQLYPGAYYVFIPASQFQAGGVLENYFSSVNNGTNETSDEGTDENGIDNATPATNGIRSIDYTLTPGGEITGEGQSNYSGTLADANVNFTVDFGFTQKYSLGNRVWFDTDNSSTINGTEVGIDGVVVNLYAANDLTTLLATDTTANGGYYLFDDLYPGDYVVSVDASNFGGILNGYWSSGTTISTAGVTSETVAPDADTTPTDSDDNGTLQTGGTLNGSVISAAVTLGPSGDTEPINESDLESGVGQGNQTDGRANMTVDFGFYTMRLGNLVWSDVDKNGAFNGTETGVDGVTVELWSGDGTLQLGTTTTAGGGLYSFPGLTQGDYIVRVVAPAGTTSSVDTFAAADTTNPTTNTDNNDNGVGTAGGIVSSNPVTLTPGLAQTSNTVDNATGSTTNPSLDFGFTPVFALGNRVWFDTDNSSTINGTEVGIDGVVVSLYSASDLTTVLQTQTTSNGGYYLFNNLLDGDYVVAIAASNFSGVLNGYWSSATSRAANGTVSETTAATANTDVDSDDNGTLQSGGPLNGAVISSVVTLGPATNAEPFGELDLDGGNQGQPDTQANMTVDFGFYTITLGDIVWNDIDNSGLLDGTEAGIDGVTVELRSGDDGTLLDTTTTSGGGFYTFDGLPTSDYIVRLPASNFNPGGVLRDYRSSTGPLPASAYEPAPDADINTTNSDDNGSETNGLLGLGGYVTSLPVTLLPGFEESFNNATGTTTESRVDFGVNNSPQIDLSVTKTDNQLYYLAGGTLNYVITVTNNGPADANGMTINDPIPPQIASWAWTCAAGTPAAYNCTDALSNSVDFSDSLDLPQLASVTYNVTAQVSPTATGNLTNTVTITPPTGMTDMTPPDNTADDTDEPASLLAEKDDGINIVAPDFTTTYTITVTNTGAADLTGITLTDTIPAGMSFVSASGGGTAAGALVTWPSFNLAAGTNTTFTVQLKVADIASLGGITSFANSVHVEDDGTKTGGTPITSDDTDTDTLANTNVKSLIDSNQSGSSNPNVLIGEILTYSIRIDIPVGTINNLSAVDVLDHGLAFVGCAPTNPVSSGTLVLGQNPCTTPAALTVQAEPVTDTNPASEEAGRHITFNFGSVQNNGTTTQTLTLNYQVIVLDIDDNVDGVKNLNNRVEWQWEGGTLAGSASGVDIVEPQLSIEKTVDPQVAALGSTLNFTIDIAHTPQSTAPAYDVSMTDVLPSGLALVAGSVTVTNSAGLPAAVVTTTATQITVFWSTFPVGETATVTFQAIFVGPSPVVNTAAVEWASIPIDPNPPMVPQSPYNQSSTERRYDPPSQTTNDYQVSSSVTVQTPTLPKTGFAPNVRTQLPPQPKDKMYAATDITIEIPSIGIQIPIVGIPKNSGSWDVTWLGGQAGWLEGTSFPTWNGNSVLTAHVYDANGLPGPFVNLNKLTYGDQIVIHAYGQKYIFAVTTNTVVNPQNVSAFKHEDKATLTLITCKEYDAKTNTYKQRVVVRAILVKVVAEP